MTERRTAEINGAHGEGGGALFRTALAAAALTHQPVRIRGIRGALRRPGITPEDLTFLKVMEAATGGESEGSEVDSEELTFSPRTLPKPVRGTFDIHAHQKGKAAGAAPVILQSAMPVLARAGGYSKLTLHGETHGGRILGYDALERATLPLHREQGIHAFPALRIAGFGYGSAGEMMAEIEPSALEPIDWQSRGPLREISGVLSWCDVRPSEVDRAADTLAGFARDAGWKMEIERLELRARQPGLTCTLWARHERGLASATAGISKGLSPVEAVREATEAMHRHLGTDATLDSFLADQALLCAAFAGGASGWTTPQITRRMLTMAWVIKQFLPVAITVRGTEGEPGSISVES